MGKITKEFAENNILLFYSKTEEEAALIQQKLFAMGFSWRDTGQEIQTLDSSLFQGMLLKNGVLLIEPSYQNKQDGSVFTLENFENDIDFNPINHLSGDVLVRTVFNQLSTRFDGLEKKYEESLQEIKALKEEVESLRKPSMNKKRLTWKDNQQK